VLSRICVCIVKGNRENSVSYIYDLEYEMSRLLISFSTYELERTEKIEE
jgi:hypothetical protein